MREIREYLKNIAVNEAGLDNDFSNFDNTLDDGSEIPEWAVPHVVGHIKDLEDGTYKAKYYAHMFELEDGRTYYCPIGVLRGDWAPWEMLTVKGIHIKNAD